MPLLSHSPPQATSWIRPGHHTVNMLQGFRDRKTESKGIVHE